MKKLKKAVMFTDIHFGAKNNSERHNKDNLEYIEWLIEQVNADPSIDHIIFLGDYYEQRSAISGQTLDYAYTGAKMINSIGLPVWFITGNHDLWHRSSREIYNIRQFETLENFTVVNEPLIVEHMGDRGAVLFPYLFEHEYPKLLEYIEYPVLFGHFEFKGFTITGDSVIKEHGPDHKHFSMFKRIFSGHYHKRDIKDNVVYIGNTFPTNFADANDTERGLAIYEYATDNLQFINWKHAPTYVKTKLSSVMDDPKSILKEKSTVECLVDIELNYEESLELKESLIKKYKLRELILDEGFDMDKLLDGDTSVDDEDDINMDALIINKLNTLSIKEIDNKKIIEEYRKL